MPKIAEDCLLSDVEPVSLEDNKFYEDLSKYDLVIHCGACMLNDAEVKYRISKAIDAGIPITNYGTALALMNGILKRSLAPFKEVQDLLD